MLPLTLEQNWIILSPCLYAVSLTVSLAFPFLYNHYIYEMIYWTITIITTPQPVSWVWDQYGCTGLMFDLMF